MKKATAIRRQELVQTAYRLLTEKGIDSITTKELARQNGISEAALYRHFANKHAIFMALLDEIESDLFQTIGKAAGDNGAPLKKLEAIMRAHMNFTERRKGGIFVITAECIHLRDRDFNQKLLGVIDRYMNTIRRILVDAKKENAINQDIDIDTAGLMFYSLIQVAAIHYVLTDYRIKPISKLRTMWNVFLRGVERDTGSRRSWRKQPSSRARAACS
ncbi:MAG: TetR family transcriptional regulator [Candidatus Edwardsbacteria bacterium]|nr:TetR family transcriptional regulator [Candidatus Edwardsbacteria bacterium]